MKEGWARRRRDWPVLAYLAGAVTLFFWPLWVAGYRFPHGGGDLWSQIYPVWSFVAEWVRRGILPLWDYRMMAGDPIFAEGQYGLFNPLNWPLFLVVPIPTWLVLARGAFSLWLAGAGLYLYLRHSPVWRLGQAGAIVGATAYMLADPFIAHLGHPQFNDAMAWLPWALWGVDRAARRGRAILPAAVAVALLLLSGHGQAALYGAMVVGLYALWQAAEGGWKRGPRRLARLAVTGAVGIALAAPAILPGLERLPFTDRAIVPWEARQGYEFPAAMSIDFLTPTFHGRGVQGFWPSWDRVESGYAGAVTLYLAALGLLGHLRQRRTWALVALGVATYDFALGYQGRLYPLLARLPFFAESWKTARAVFLLSFVLAIAAALGVERLRTGPRRGILLWAAGLVAVGGLLWLNAPAWVARVPTGVYQGRALAGLRFAALLAWGTALLGWAASGRRQWNRAGLVLLLLAELVALGALADVERPSAAADPHAAALAFLRADTGWFRVDVDAKARGLWSPSLLMALGFEVPQGTGNPMDLAAVNQFYWSIPHQDSPRYRLLGVKYIVVPKGAPPGGQGIWPVFTDDPLVDIHLHTGSLPRAWLVYRTVPVKGIEEAYAVMSDLAFAPEQAATVEDGPALEGSGEGRIEVIAYAPNRLAMALRTSAPALLVLSDVLYPGWEARMDGEPVTIYRTDGIFRGVPVPPGEHRLEMLFRPRSMRSGVGIAASAIWTLAVVGWMNRVLLRRGSQVAVCEGGRE